MSTKLNLGLMALLSLSPCGLTPARADSLADQGREIYKNHRSAVVTVQVVIKNKLSMMGMGGRSSESKQDVTGTVIDPSGLTVLSLSATDPGSMLQNLMSGLSDEDSKIKMESELSDIKILMEDGTEVPAEVVLRDKDLDLAFVRPKTKPATPMAALDFRQSATAELLDQVITLNRLGEAAGRAYSVSVERIGAIVRKPRLFYIPDSTATATSLGSPAFLPDGKVLGLVVMRAVKGDGGGGLFGGLQGGNMTAIIVPAEKIQKGAEQAPQPKESSKSEGKEEK